MRNFIGWVLQYFKPYVILLVTPEEDYRVVLFRGHCISINKVPRHGLRGIQLNTIIVDMVNHNG